MQRVHYFFREYHNSPLNSSWHSCCVVSAASCFGRIVTIILGPPPNRDYGSHWETSTSPASRIRAATSIGAGVLRSERRVFGSGPQSPFQIDLSDELSPNPAIWSCDSDGAKCTKRPTLPRALRCILRTEYSVLSRRTSPPRPSITS